MTPDRSMHATLCPGCRWLVRRSVVAGEQQCPRCNFREPLPPTALGPLYSPDSDQPRLW